MKRQTLFNKLFPFPGTTGSWMVAALLALSSVSAVAATRGISIDLKASTSPDAKVEESVDLYSESHALIIGIDGYNNGWPKLSNAIKDAELVSATLKERGFNVTFHKDLMADQLEDVFKEFFIIQGEKPSARLFVWFAGHGATLDGEGYLVPADAPVPTQEAEFKYSALNLRRFGTFMRQAKSKHVYAVFDSCFAGTVFASQRAMPSAAITRATTLPVRQFLTSGDEDQTVSDDGAFRQLFLRAINGEEDADSNRDGYLTATELGLYLGDRVTNLTESLQTPRYGKLRDKDYDRGDFVFLIPGAGDDGGDSDLPDTPGGDNSAEIAFWESVKDSKNVAAFDAYLQQYPDGVFALLANLKKTELTTQPRPAPPGPRPDPQLAATTPTITSTQVQADTPPAEVASSGESATPSGPSAQDTTVANIQATARDIQAGLQATAKDLVALVSSSTTTETAQSSAEPEPASTEPTNLSSPPPAAAPRNLPPVNTASLIANADVAPAIRQRMTRYLTLAQEGNVSAQFSLGYMFDRGEIVGKNKRAAEKWYTSAAEKDNVRAQVNLAKIYEEGGEDIPQDWNRAISWYRKAAESGDGGAQEKLGYLYEHGLGLGKDPFAAAEYYLRAAEQGLMTAQNNLGRLYQLGAGVRQDNDQAVYWYEKAAAQGSEAARANLSKLKTP